jgi:hypothetical protein
MNAIAAADMGNRGAASDVKIIGFSARLDDAMHESEKRKLLAIELTNSPKVKRDTSKLPSVLPQSELESLKQEMQDSSVWMRAELKRRRELRRKQ